jgi:alkylation response protein AidB-like acyl-CoA dehydrogenase
MPNYTPPLDDIRFVLNEVLNADDLADEIPSYQDADWETISGMLEVIGSFIKDDLFPQNFIGDEQGLEYNSEEKTVKTPEGFKALHKNFLEIGLLGLTGDPNDGGSGMPSYLGAALNEMVCTNIAYAIFPGLTGGAYKALKKFGSDELKDNYLAELLDGTTSGTMCLTEPQAGTDLALVKTKAEPEEDGSFSITGNKIFISYGEHDLSENTLHLVLARLPDAPEGIKGISLFAVPKYLPKDNGELGERNEAWCTGIEEKMGIHASPTCSMSFDGAKGWLVGEPNKGMQAMFSMMNDARLKAGIQGLSIAELAYQNFAEYAAERVQGKDLKQSFNPAAKAVPILNHANIKKSLLDMKSQIEGFRALTYDTAIALDIAEKHPEAVARNNADEYAALMTPVIKACMTDLSVDVANKATQLYGGAGYITETGAHQYYRDALIGTIYEGTNDIQSMDFTFRKALNTEELGYKLGLFMNPTYQEISIAKHDPKLSDHAAILENSFNTFQNTTMSLIQQGMSGKVDDLLVHSRDFMDMFGKLAVGRMWLKMMNTANEKLENGASGKEAEFYNSKIELGDYYLNNVMTPEIKKLEARIDAGASIASKVDSDKLLPGEEIGIGTQANKSQSNKPFLKRWL